MNRKQFMEQLERLLSDISEAERQEALEYYEGYFDDAGPENEGEVIRKLGNPGKVAAIIKADLQENSEDYGEYTENGYQDTRVKENGEMPDQYTEITVRGDGQEEEPHDTGSAENRRKSRAQRGYHAEKKQNKAGIILALPVLFLQTGEHLPHVDYLVPKPGHDLRKVVECTSVFHIHKILMLQRNVMIWL